MNLQREHLARIFSTVENPRPVSSYAMVDGNEWRPFAASWTRCIHSHGLDPAKSAPLTALGAAELHEHRQSYEEWLRIAGDELDHLFAAVRVIGFSVSFASPEGVILAERSDYSKDHYCEADRPGTVWSENVVGTNGVGTALAEMRSTAVYLGDHFYSDFANYCCVATPVFGPDAELMGAINLSVCNPLMQEETHRLVYGIAQRSAERLDERAFRERFRAHSVVRLTPRAGRAALVALDVDQQIVGADRAARVLLGMAESTPGGSVWSYFERDRRLFENGTTAASFELRGLRPGLRVTASLTPPLDRAIAARPVVKAGHSLDDHADDRTSARPRAAAPANSGAIPDLDACAGSDPRMLSNARLLRRVIGSRLPILLLGETGVGKDTLARAIHLESERAGKPFVAFNCAAVPETLIDSELFGYGSGAFTGARREGNAGRLAEADGGVLFLDEIGDMPYALQTRLLRVLETGEVMPLGAGKMRRVDIQVIAATNQDLEKRIAARTFRQDLYYRLAGAVIHVPSLRERTDLDGLIDRLLAHAAEGRDIRLDSAARSVLRSHRWPGNVRELKHVLFRAVQIANGGIIRPADLMMGHEGAPAVDDISDEPAETGGAAKAAVAAAERGAIAEAMERAGGNVEACARLLGMSRATLYRKIRRHGLEF
jgi:transcriptional regulator of acetoin/glycerol metabolism